MGEGPALLGVVGVVLEFDPHPEGVEGREQDAETVLLTQGEEVVPELDDIARPLAGARLKVAAANLGVLEHQAEDGDAMGLQFGQVGLDGGDVLAAEERVELDPADGVVLADGMPGLAVFGLEVRDARDDLDPGKGCSGKGLERCGRHLGEDKRLVCGWWTVPAKAKGVKWHKDQGLDGRASVRRVPMRPCGPTTKGSERAFQC